MRPILFYLLLFVLSSLYAQPRTKTISFKKGEVMDIILLNEKPGTDSLQKRFFSTAFAVARREGYQPVPGFRISESPLRGNYHPGTMVFGKWPSVAGRQAALEAIETEVEDFHQLRRAIWSNFYLTYWECPDNISFSIDPERYTVTTAFWQASDHAFSAFARPWIKAVEQAGGKILLQLKDGVSPFGYHYAPELLLIISWPSSEAYRSFRETAPPVDREAVRHLNEFAIR